MRYAILHGGINTINEVIMFGVPIIGVPLQVCIHTFCKMKLKGDQLSNLQRLTELKMAQLIDIKSIRNGLLPSKMHLFDTNLWKYRQRAVKISKMVNMYRLELFNSDITQQKFWLRWATRYGERIRKNAKIFHFYYCSFATHFCLYELSAFLIILLIFMGFLTQK